MKSILDLLFNSIKFRFLSRSQNSSDAVFKKIIILSRKGHQKHENIITEPLSLTAGFTPDKTFIYYLYFMKNRY